MKNLLFNQQDRKLFLYKYCSSLSAFFLLIMFCLLSAKYSFSQINANNFTAVKHLESSDSTRLFLRIKNTNFLKNNEYFGKMVKGYTLIGYHLTPTLAYFPTGKTKIEAGAHFLKYSGIEKFTDVLPVFSFQYQPSAKFSLVLGSLYGSLNHNMPEPLYFNERHFTNNIENGLQFLINTKRIKSDIWINWEQFIFHEDPLQEILSTGTSSQIYLNNPDVQLHLQLNINTLIAHRGGQIDNNERNMQSLGNTSTGLSISYNSSHSFLKKATAEITIFTYNDLSPSPEEFFKNGWGFLSSLRLESKSLQFDFQYWKANNFIAARGEPMYMCISQNDSTYFEQNRKLLIAKLAYNKNISKGIFFQVGGELFYDIINKQADYWYGLFLVFNSDFLIKKIKP